MTVDKRQRTIAQTACLKTFCCTATAAQTIKSTKAAFHLGEYWLVCTEGLQWLSVSFSLFSAQKVENNDNELV